MLHQAPQKLKLTAHREQTAPALTVVTLQKAVGQPLTIGHLIALALGIIVGIAIMICVNMHQPAPAIVTTQPDPVHATIVLPGAALDVSTHAAAPVTETTWHDPDKEPVFSPSADDAYALLKAERYDDAIDAYHHLFQHTPSREPEFGYLIDALEHSTTPQAEKELEQLLKENPNDARLPYALGNLALQTDNYSKAASYYQLATAIEPEKAEIWFAQGIASDHLNDSKGALMAYQHAMMLYQQRPPADNATLKTLHERVYYLREKTAE